MTANRSHRDRLVLVAERSPAFRRSAARALGQAGEWVCETAATILEARDKIVQLRPDLLVIEAEMPGNSGGEFVERLRKYHPMPMVGLARGPVPPALYTAVVMRDAGEAIALAELTRIVRDWAPTERPASYRIIAIGASTGGTEAVEQVLRMMSAESPGVLIAQHIPKQFSQSFASRLNRMTPFAVREAADGDVVRDGVALVAPGDQHMRVALVGDHWQVRLDSGPKLWHQRPAVDLLFDSVAHHAAPHAVGVLLTGMGQDGAAGLLQMRRSGCWTIAQNEASCVVFGMPRAAIEAGAACEVAALDRVAAAIEARTGAARLPSALRA